MSRIIIATEYVGESQNSTGYFWSRIIAKLKSEAFDVKVVQPSFRIKYDAFEGGGGILGKILSQLKISFSLARKISQEARGDTLVFTGTNPAILLCVMPILKRFYRFKWILLVHDVFPENLVAAGFVSEKKIAFKLACGYFNWIYSSPDKLICIGRDMQKLVARKTGGKAKAVYIPNWVNEGEVYPLPRRLGSFGWDDCVVFQFFGNIGRLQGVGNLLNAISMVAAQNAAFIFIGGGAMVSEVESFIKDNPQIKIKYLGFMPLERKNEGLSLCDVALVTLEEGMLGLGVPSKTYFSLAAGKPILAAVEPESEIGLMLEEYPVGWRCGPNSPRQLAELIDEICLFPMKIDEKTPREIFLNNYSESKVLRKIIAEIRVLY